MLSVIYWTILAILAILAVAVLAALLARIIAYGVRVGWDRGARPRRTRLVTYHAPAPAPLGGICGADHWVMPGRVRCRLGHAHMPTETAKTAEAVLILAREEHYRWSRARAASTEPHIDDDGQANDAELQAQRDATGW